MTSTCGEDCCEAIILLRKVLDVGVGNGEALYHVLGACLESVQTMLWKLV